MANENEGNIRLTPEQQNQRLKELVAASLGLVIVVSTLILAGFTFLYAGDSTKISDAKDVLQVMLGIAGVVVGYYFGRVPADSHAALAQDQANAAIAQTEQVNAKAQEMADKIGLVMDQTTSGLMETRGAGGQAIDTVELKKIRDELRTLATISKRRS